MLKGDKQIRQNKQKEILVKVSLLEAAMLLKLRKYDYGDFRIIKMAGNPTRIIFEGSEMLKESDGIVLSLDDIDKEK